MPIQNMKCADLIHCGGRELPYGNIDHFHKNHKYNLIPLCKTHHKLVHEGKIIISGFVMTSEGLKLHYEIKDTTDALSKEQS